MQKRGCHYRQGLRLALDGCTAGRMLRCLGETRSPSCGRTNFVMKAENRRSPDTRPPVCESQVFLSRPSCVRAHRGLRHPASSLRPRSLSRRSRLAGRPSVVAEYGQYVRPKVSRSRTVVVAAAPVLPVWSYPALLSLQGLLHFHGNQLWSRVYRWRRHVRHHGVAEDRDVTAPPVQCSRRQLDLTHDRVGIAVSTDDLLYGVSLFPNVGLEILRWSLVRTQVSVPYAWP